MRFYSYPTNKKRKWTTISVQPEALDYARQMSAKRKVPVIKLVTDLIRDEWMRESTELKTANKNFA